MVTKEGKASQLEAVDCRWFIRAPPGSRVIPPDLYFGQHVNYLVYINTRHPSAINSFPILIYFI